MFDPAAAATLAGRLRRTGGMVDAVAGRLGGPPPADRDPWRVDPALALVTDAACTRLLAVAAEFNIVALALRSAVVSYRQADDRAVARLRGRSRPW